MLQRAASNAYSWWWASHIRTKQSKWLEQHLQDMEEKVETMLKLIQEDGDSFAKRAEMYYKRRPELIEFVEESYRAYRSLAERYDHISTELQNANNTIASVFPEQVQLSMDEEDEEPSPRFPRKKTEIPKQQNIPKTPTKDLKPVVLPAPKKLPTKKSLKASASFAVAKSGLSKSEALQEIDKLQKQILTLQTEKEFLKSSYEDRVAKFREVDNQIKEMQQRIFNLQDEFGEGMLIDDGEARSLMAAAALKSCQETLSKLQEKHNRSTKEAKLEFERIRDQWRKIEAFKGEFHCVGKSVELKKESKSIDRKIDSPVEEKKESELLLEKIKEQIGSTSELTVPEMVEKIDKLVKEVIGLENEVSSQDALGKCLRTEMDELQEQIRTLEDDKPNLVYENGIVSSRVLEMEERLRRIQDLNQKVENKNANLQTNFSEARCNLDVLSVQLPNLKEDETIQTTNETTVRFVAEVGSQKEIKSPEGESKPANDFKELLGAGEVRKEISHTEVMSPRKNKQEGDEQRPENGLQYLQSVKSNEGPQVIGSAQSKETDVEVKSSKETKNEEESSNSGKSSKNAVVIDTPSNQVEDAGETFANDKPNNQSKKNQDPEHLDKDEKTQTSTVNDLVDNKEGEPGSSEQGSLESEDKKESDGSVPDVQAPKEIKNKEESSNSGKSSKNAVVIDTPSNQEEDVGETLANDKHNNLCEKIQDPEHLDKDEKTQTSTINDLVDNKEGEHGSSQQGSLASEDKKESDGSVPDEQARDEDEPDWRQLFLNGLQDREKALLAQYTTTLRNYKDAKKKLNEIENTSSDGLTETSKQLKELKIDNAMKDEEIKSLRQKLNHMQNCFYESKDQDKSIGSKESLEEIEKEEKDFNFVIRDEPATTSAVEERFRVHIDELLEENLEFWFKFSTSFQEIQKFETEIQDLLDEVKKIEEKRKRAEGSTHRKNSLRSDIRPIYKHFGEKQTELTVWLDKSALLKDELQSRFSSLCNIQEEISNALKASAEDDDFKFTSYQAAKFQGEVLNMKQENNKVADELQVGLDHVTTLQLDVEKTLVKLNDDFQLSGSEKSPELRHTESKNRVPLQSFIFGVKPKKQKQSIFSCVAPAMHKKYHGL